MTREPSLKLPPDGEHPHCFFSTFFYCCVCMCGGYNTVKHSLCPLYSLSSLHGLKQGGGWRGEGREGARETHNSHSEGTYLFGDYTIYIQ